MARGDTSRSPGAKRAKIETKSLKAPPRAAGAVKASHGVLSSADALGTSSNNQQPASTGAAAPSLQTSNSCALLPPMSISNTSALESLAGSLNPDLIPELLPEKLLQEDDVSCLGTEPGDLLAACGAAAVQRFPANEKIVLPVPRTTEEKARVYHSFSKQVQFGKYSTYRVAQVHPPIVFDHGGAAVKEVIFKSPVLSTAQRDKTWPQRKPLVELQLLASLALHKPAGLLAPLHMFFDGPRMDTVFAVFPRLQSFAARQLTEEQTKAFIRPIANQVANGLHVLHVNDVYHRDITEDTLLHLFTDGGKGIRVQIGEFSCASDDNPPTQEHSFLPELVNFEQIDHHFDVLGKPGVFSKKKENRGRRLSDYIRTMLKMPSPEEQNAARELREKTLNPITRLGTYKARILEQPDPVRFGKQVDIGMLAVFLVDLMNKGADESKRILDRPADGSMLKASSSSSTTTSETPCGTARFIGSFGQELQSAGLHMLVTEAGNHPSTADKKPTRVAKQAQPGCMGFCDIPLEFEEAPIDATFGFKTQFLPPALHAQHDELRKLASKWRKILEHYGDFGRKIVFSMLRFCPEDRPTITELMALLNVPVPEVVCTLFPKGFEERVLNKNYLLREDEAGFKLEREQMLATQKAVLRDMLNPSEEVKSGRRQAIREMKVVYCTAARDAGVDQFEKILKVTELYNSDEPVFGAELQKNDMIKLLEAIVKPENNASSPRKKVSGKPGSSSPQKTGADHKEQHQTLFKYEIDPKTITLDNGETKALYGYVVTEHEIVRFAKSRANINASKAFLQQAVSSGTFEKYVGKQAAGVRAPTMTTFFKINLPREFTGMRDLADRERQHTSI
ncbi:unnamed protein product [Amoebophrya sp. A120]|nr:unnamed protein product [Amoebophrya sp. A120]|eukprot:GSA120T00001513001.1